MGFGQIAHRSSYEASLTPALSRPCRAVRLAVRNSIHPARRTTSTARLRRIAQRVVFAGQRPAQLGDERAASSSPASSDRACSSLPSLAQQLGTQQAHARFARETGDHLLDDPFHQRPAAPAAAPARRNPARVPACRASAPSSTRSSSTATTSLGCLPTAPISAASTCAASRRHRPAKPLQLAPGCACRPHGGRVAATVRRGALCGWASDFTGRFRGPGRPRSPTGRCGWRARPAPSVGARGLQVPARGIGSLPACRANSPAMPLPAGPRPAGPATATCAATPLSRAR